MTVADQIEDHQARCLPHVLRLRMLARDEAEAPLPWLVAAEVVRATAAILAEVESAILAEVDAEVRVTAGGSPGAGIFLSVRLSRLAASADDAIAAAGAGNFPLLRRHLRRFDSLTSAIWAVRDAITGP